MDSMRCPYCEKPIVEFAHFCANCGKSITASEPMMVEAGQRLDVYTPQSPQALYVAEELYAEDEEYALDDVLTQELVDVASHHLTWHKELERPVEPENALFPPRPSQAHPVVALRPLHAYKALGIKLTPTLPLRLLSLGILLLFLVSGIFFTFGHGLFNASASPQVPTLHATSSSIASGATLILHGSNFSPHGLVALSRDTLIPVIDTSYVTRILADANGDFTDSIMIPATWQSGMHTVNAEDALLHKIARFPLFVTGQNTSLRPGHLAISTTVLDMGAGDFATHSTRQITLSNIGGGQITWQGSTDQSWLQITPRQGTIDDIAQSQVTVAVDRSHLKVGSYSAHLNLTSNMGNNSVVVKMSVVPLNAGQDAVLAVSPAVLAFSATDGGNSPSTQTVTVSNLGVRPLAWNVTTNVSWLSVSPQSGALQNSTSTTNGLITSTPTGTGQVVTVGINSGSLLPGTYSGVITFSGQGTQQVKDSPQSIVVTITINPQCVLQVAPSLLTFTGAYGQTAPTSQNIGIGVSQGCTKTMAWSATAGSQWLQLNTNSGTTPTHPTVSINDIGLNPGTYNSSIVFTTATSTDTVPVTLVLGQPNAPLMAVSTNVLNYSGIVGQTNIPPQNIVITNSAGGTLNWQTAFAATTGGNWLHVLPASGSLAAHQSVSLSITAQTNGLAPYNYSGALTISSTDTAGHTAAGSPQMVQVNFNVQGACTVTAAPGSLSFSGIAGQTAPAPQSLSITAAGACSHTIAWRVTSAASWLFATQTGVVTPTTASTSSVSISLAGLTLPSYSSSLTLAANDSVTNQAIGSPIQIPVTLQVQPACTLQAPSLSGANFSTEAGQSPAAQTFTLAASGTCNGNITVTPALTVANGSGWLSVNPVSATIASGGSATFTISVFGTSLTVGPYSGTITLNASNGGLPIVGSPQKVTVAVAVAAAPSLSASAGAAALHGTNGVSAQPVNIANTGGGSLNWSATMSGAPAFVGLSPTSGTLVAGSSDTTNVVVTNAAGVVSGSYTATVTFVAIDTATGTPVSGSPVSVAITINVAPPAMQLSTTVLNYSTNAGTDPNTQSLSITNVGGAPLTWTAGPPSAAWLTLDSNSGSDSSNTSSTLTFSVHTTGLTGPSYSATVLITPSAGPPVTVTVNLTIASAAPALTPTVSAATTTPTPTATPTASAI